MGILRILQFYLYRQALRIVSRWENKLWRWCYANKKYKRIKR